MLDSDPNYWWDLAEDCWEVKTCLRQSASNSRACRRAYVDKCHGAIERQLKAILAQQGRLEDEDATHNLVMLFYKVGLWGTIPLSTQVYIKGISNIHNLACYYSRSGMDQTWDTETGFATMDKVFDNLYATLGKLRKEEEGGQGGSTQYRH